MQKEAVCRGERGGFTLIEVLISIALLGIIVVALFSTVAMMKESNAHLLEYLKKAKVVTEATKVLYRDIINSDGNITIKKDEFAQVCIESTRNSLYALSEAKVCWVVLKKEHTLTRVEGNGYQLPTRFDDRVEVNPVMKHMEIFDLYHQEDKLLVLIKEKGKDPIKFLVQGVTRPKPKTKLAPSSSGTQTKPPHGQTPPSIAEENGKVPPKSVAPAKGQDGAEGLQEETAQGVEEEIVELPVKE
jgi:prepilin-type N-terminal cleavage/methylation domain-containing protein